MFSGTHGAAARSPAAAPGTSLPRPQPEQRQPHVREHARAARCPPCARTNAAARAHVLGVGRVAGQAQRPVGLDRRRQLARAAVEVRPRAVGALLGADPGGRALGLVGAADAEELAQEHVLGVHRHVRLQLALPPAGVVLQREQVLAGALQRHLRLAASLYRRARTCRKARTFCASATRAHGCAVRRRWRAATGTSTSGMRAA